VAEHYSVEAGVDTMCAAVLAAVVR
jgi:hypothetical protein